jgi:hypothetical protein
LIKKLFVGVIAAGALSLPLAGVVAAEPAPDNSGVPGAIGGQAPGSFFRDMAKVPDSSTKGALGGIAPGQLVKSVAPGQGSGL